MNDKLKIVLVCTSLNELGGKNNHLKNIYTHLSKNGFEICIISSSKVAQDLKNFFVTSGVRPEDIVLLARWKKWLIIPFIWELKRIFKERAIDIVHCFQIQSDVLGGIAAKLAGIKHLYSYYESKLIPDNISFLKRIPYQIANFLIKRCFEKTIVVSNGLKNEILRKSFRATQSVRVIPLGINMPDRSEIKGKPQGQPLVIGTLARYSQEKALDRIIRAVPIVLKEIPEVQCVLIGQGPEEDALKCLAQELGVQSNIVFKPWTENIWEELNAMDVFLMSSRREGCPTSLLEALAAKKAVVASDIEGVRDIIENNREGLLVDTSDAGAFAGSIISLCRDAERVRQLGLNGFEKVKNVFSIPKEMDSLKKIYLSAQ